MSATNKPLVTKLCLLVVAMFGFGYALVPLYNVFCEITGLNGKTGRLSVETAAAMQTDESRWIKVEFVTSVNSGFPWQFRPLVTSINVRPGVETEVAFEVINQSAESVTGQAVPSVAPSEGARYFSKTECFCFTQQALLAGETKQMPVRFIVNPKLPKHIDTLTLGYTFFRSTEQISSATSTTIPAS
jgi:cytochrome c oxidase assembly protein subunit 11